MNVGCNCLGIAATSRVPSKGYNKLMPPVFPKDPPVTPISEQQHDRQLEKLISYLAVTPDCITKVQLALPH